LSETWISAQSITVERDGSYRVHFLPPRKPDPNLRRPTGTLPPLPPRPSVPTGNTTYMSR
jgi:hypothetical protein